MLTLKIALRNIFRNTRRSMTTLATIALGAAAVLVFGAYITYIQYGVQTGAVQRTGHLQIFRSGYFTFGTGAPAAWGISHYQAVIDLVRADSVLSQLATVVTPIQSLAGIAGNFANDTSKTFFGTGFVPSERDRMKQWNEYGTGSQGIKRSGMKDDEPSRGIAGAGLVRMLGLCAPLHLEDCPKAPAAPAPPSDDSASFPPAPATLAELSQRDRLPSAAESGEGTPTIDLLAATGSGAPNVVRLELARVEVQPFKELDDNYVGMHLKLAQDLIYGRGEHQTTGIVLQLHRTEDMEVARARLLLLFKTHHLDLEIRDFTDLTPQYTQITALFRSIFSFIILIIAIVALFTVSNAMSMSVIERTAEIGTIRAMGVRRQGIRRQFLVEGSLLGVVGATVGVLVGYAVAYGVNHLQLSWTPPGAAAPVPLRLYMAGAYLLILVTWVGLVFTSALAASIPASRAARMPVVDALRHV